MGEDFAEVAFGDRGLVEYHGGVTKHEHVSLNLELNSLQVTMLVMLANGETIKTAAWKARVPYQTGWWWLREARKSLEATSLAQAVVRAMQLSYISYPTGADLQSFPLRWDKNWVPSTT